MNFKQLGIDLSILRALKEIGYQSPTEIQRKAIPFVKAGRDLLGCAKTGTGKTGAFSIPMLELMGKPKQDEQRNIKGLILTPTRELALQIYENICHYSRYTGRVPAVIYGGVSQIPQVEALKRGADILIATTGRLCDLIDQKLVSIANVEYFVLDEADVMLDMGFINDVKKIIKYLPKKRQTLMFSATIPKEIKMLANEILNKPARVEILDKVPTADKIKQLVYNAEKNEKSELLRRILNEKNNPQTIVFCRTKYGADKVARYLYKNQIKVRSIHGDKSQGARQSALKLFKEKKINVLVATDIAARGLDISGLPLVVNYDLPNIPETYVHRIGRTGRAGMEGEAISFCSNEEAQQLNDIENLIKFKIEKADDIKTTSTQKNQKDVKQVARRRKITKRTTVQTESELTKRRRIVSPQTPKAQPLNDRSNERKSHLPIRTKPQRDFVRTDMTERQRVQSERQQMRSSSRINDEFSMDISSPRIAKISDEAAARIRAKVQAKLKEREMARQKTQKIAVKPSNIETKKPIRRTTRRPRSRGYLNKKEK